jgi:hypothetical protein
VIYEFIIIFLIPNCVYVKLIIVEIDFHVDFVPLIICICMRRDPRLKKVVQSFDLAEKTCHYFRIAQRHIIHADLQTNAFSYIIISLFLCIFVT